MVQEVAKASKVGKFMLFAAWIIAMVLLTQMFGWFHESKVNPNRQPVASVSDSGQQQLVLDRNQWGHYLFNGFINGTETTFLVDTGATLVAIPEALADEMNLPKFGKSSVQTANGITTAYRTKLDSLQIGPFLLRDINATILPAMDSDQEVLLGMSALKHLAFSQRRGQLILEPLE